MTSRDARVVGLNMVQPEDDMVAMRDFSLHMRMIRALSELYPDVPVTLHAGELAPGLVPPEGLRFHIRESVRVAGAKRIGHGVDIAHEDSAVALMKEMASKGVLVEIALTSNAGILGVSGAQHPLSLYLEHGVPVALATDDEGVSRSDMTHEYLRAVQEQKLGYSQLKTMARNSLQYSFADAATKKALLAKLDREFDALEARYAPLGDR
jgi:adenosine deaminase